jgi:uncharacterized membrane protein
MISRLSVPIVLLLATGAADLVVYANGQGPVRIALSIGFLMFVPGWAVMRIADPPLDLLARTGLAVAISVAIDMAVATGLLYLRLWSAGLALTIVSVVVVVSVLLELPSSRAAIQREARRAWSALSSLDQR